MTELKLKKSKIFKSAAIILSVAAIIVSFLAGFFLRSALIGSDAAALSEVAAYLKKYGVFDSDSMELKEFSAEDAARLVIANAPDKYATYYSKEEYAAVKNNYAGKYEGVGIALYKETLKIAKVIVNSPAFNAGIKCGDILLFGSVKDETPTYFSDILSVNSFLSAAGAGEFYLTVSRDGEQKTFVLKAEKYKSSYLLYKDKDFAYAYTGNYNSELTLKKTGEGISELPENVAYISFDGFEGGAADEFKGILKLMSERGKTKLILDVRGNGGGYMDVLSDFAAGVIKSVDGGKFTLAYSKDNKGEYTEYKSAKNYYGGMEKIAVIADEFSASATECLIGAMIYYGGAFSIGNLVIENEELSDGVAHTFGKGIMQSTFMLSNGGALKLTTAIIYQPDKTTRIHGKGITVSGENAVKKSESKAIARAIDVLAE